MFFRWKNALVNVLNSAALSAASKTLSAEIAASQTPDLFHNGDPQAQVVISAVIHKLIKKIEKVIVLREYPKLPAIVVPSLCIAFLL